MMMAIGEATHNRGGQRRHGELETCGDQLDKDKMSVRVKEYNKEAWNDKSESSRLDSDLKLEELGENENSKLDLDKKGDSRA
eukprot:7166761-Heterocapsa_arctica.AAC.1